MDNSYRPDPNRTHTEAVQAVAEAIWRVDGARPSRFPFSDLGDGCAYRAMAEAAIEAHAAALGLTEEVSIRVGQLVGCVMSRAEAEAKPHREVVASRLVSPWVAVPDSGGSHE